MRKMLTNRYFTKRIFIKPPKYKPPLTISKFGWFEIWKIASCFVLCCFSFLWVTRYNTAEWIFEVCLVSEGFLIYKEILSIHSLKYQPHGVDIFYFTSVKEEFWLDIKRLVSNTINNFPAMFTQITDLLKFLKRNWCSFISLFHCMIHFTNIYAQFSQADSMKFVLDTVVKISQCIHVNAINHYKCIGLRKEVKDNLMGSWPILLSGEKVLQTFTVLLTLIPIFILESKGIFTKYPIIRDLKNGIMIFTPISYCI